MQATKFQEGKINITDFGLNIEINPVYLLKESMSHQSKVMLDNLIKAKLIEVLNKFKNSEENTEEYRNRLYQKEVTSLLIKDIATVERDLVHKLHSDGETIFDEDGEGADEKFEELVEIREFAYSVWKYDTYYGFKSITKLKEDGHNH